MQVISSSYLKPWLRKRKPNSSFWNYSSRTSKAL